MRFRLRAEPGIKDAIFSDLTRPSASPSHTIDVYDRSGFWNGNARLLAPAGVGADSPVRRHQDGSIDPAVYRTRGSQGRPRCSDRHGVRPRRVPEEFSWNGQKIFDYFEAGPDWVWSSVDPRAGDDKHAKTGHGTPVSSIIAAVNDGGTGLSGVLNSLVRPTEPPFNIFVYRKDKVLRPEGGYTYETATLAALDHIKSRNANPATATDVVNMSFGDYVSELTHLSALRALRGRTLVVASGGNDGLDTG